ncbi:S-methyl-5-thioribose kinase [Paludibacterium yongneupense]|uniref:S-methyl-5-thioribose kinase n=1 Tax=Paludibacterium yongneupense TaxID=400061 RepID=UPI000406FD76|nr:S-methyl-5-thioribose kinase [Paludibacterium yongneupense]
MGIEIPAGYRPLDDDSLRRWLSGVAVLAERLGGPSADWTVEEVGDGNLNLVFLVRGATGGVCVKQSLPYVRVVGESWPMPLERTFFEACHLSETAAHVGRLAPALLHYDATLFVLVEELLEPHRVLRGALIAGVRYPDAARAVAEYVAKNGVLSSVLAQPFEKVFDRAAVFAANQALTRVTTELVFADPYREQARNRWSSPQLDDAAASIRHDARLKLAVARLGQAFLTRHDALLHGDLHTGSVMVSASDTRVIDPEFARYGPLGFDLGNFVANLLTAYFSQPGHETRAGERTDYGEWILAQIDLFWRHFVLRYQQLWREQTEGDAYPVTLFEEADGQRALQDERQRAVAALLDDTLGFAGAEIIRRILGFAHNREFEAIPDPDVRARLERRALQLARRLLLEKERFGSIEAVLAAARAVSEYEAEVA